MTTTPRRQVIWWTIIWDKSTLTKTSFPQHFRYFGRVIEILSGVLKCRRMNRVPPRICKRCYRWTQTHSGWPDWANFLLVGAGMLWAGFENYKSSLKIWATFSTEIVILTEKGMGATFGAIFFTNSSGHPGAPAGEAGPLRWGQGDQIGRIFA
jgi:hypothetical protein